MPLNPRLFATSTFRILSSTKNGLGKPALAAISLAWRKIFSFGFAVFRLKLVTTFSLGKTSWSSNFDQAKLNQSTEWLEMMPTKCPSLRRS